CSPQPCRALRVHRRGKTGEGFQGPGISALVSQLQPDRQALGMQRPGGPGVTLLAGDLPQIVERDGDAHLAPKLPRDSQTLLIEGPGCLKVTLLESHIPLVGERGGDASSILQLPENR